MLLALFKISMVYATVLLCGELAFVIIIINLLSSIDYLTNLLPMQVCTQLGSSFVGLIDGDLT